MEKFIPKSIYIYIAVLLLYGTSCSKPNNSFTIHGQLDHVTDSLLIAVKEMGDSLTIDTIRINNKGEFKINGQVDTLTVVSLYFKDSAISPYVLVDKGWNVNIKGDINYPDLIQVKGGTINNDLSAFKESVQELLKSRANMLLDENTDIDSEEDSVSIRGKDVKLKNINFELMNRASEYVTANRSKVSSVLIINNFFKNEESLDRLTESLKLLKGRALDFPLTERLKAYEEYIRKSAVGSTAPAFTIKDTANKDISIREFNGKFVLLTFTSTECTLCHERYTKLKDEYKTLTNGKEKYNIDFVIVIKDIEEKPIDNLITNEKWTLLPVQGGWATKIFEDYNISNIPYNILISPQGKILERNISVINLKNTLDKYPLAKIETKSKTKK